MVNNTIPADQIVNIVPSVLGAGGKALDLNGLILTRSPELPTMTPVSFPDANSVADYFGPSSAELSPTSSGARCEKSSIRRVEAAPSAGARRIETGRGRSRSRRGACCLRRRAKQGHEHFVF